MAGLTKEAAWVKSQQKLVEGVGKKKLGADSVPSQGDKNSTENNRAVGVQLASGKVYRASGLSPILRWDTFEKLLPAEEM